MNAIVPTRSRRFALRRRLVLAPVLLAATFAGAPAPAQEKPDRIDEIFSWATLDAPGCVCAVSQQGTVVVNRAYGSADLERQALLSADSVFDIGSLRKQFIAAAILMLVEEGKLSLDDDVRKHVPELPDYGHTITLDHLLTHTSGIRDWPGMLALAGGNVDVLNLILRQRDLNFPPGEEWAYCNSGYVLLKEIVVRVSGTPFPEFTRARMFQPLGMTATAYHDDLRDVIKNRALPYVKESGVWKQDMLVGHQRGSGGALFSTAGDLLLWNQALADKRLGAFVSDKLQQPAKLNNGRQLRYARGLIMDSVDGVRVVLHSGGAGGYSAWLGRLPEHDLSIAVLCNADEMGTSRLARRVADEFLPPAAPDNAGAGDAPAAAADAHPAVSDLTGKTGLFFCEATGLPLRLTARNGELRVVDGPALVAIDTDRYRNPHGNLHFMSQDEFQLHFLSGDRLELTTMEGQTRRFRRAVPYAPTPDDLKSFSGRYRSDELGSTFEIVPAGDGLLMRYALSPEQSLPLRPADRDTFQFSRILVRFERGPDGRAVAFDYSNPLVRKLRFHRVSDRD